MAAGYAEVDRLCSLVAGFNKFKISKSSQNDTMQNLYIVITMNQTFRCFFFFFFFVFFYSTHWLKISIFSFPKWQWMQAKIHKILWNFNN